ncbi:MAG: SNF2-related protein [Longimonas sp.]|uniref:SNF2-related protein n=1 Tax=Longimonas sp. TaxID=2039626 RepID=UPI003976A768
MSSSPRDLFDSASSNSEPTWPAPHRFALNETERTVGTRLDDLFAASEQVLFLTGYTSLAHLARFFSRHDVGERTIEIVLGNQPTPDTRGTFVDTLPVDEQARAFWMERGISVLSGRGITRLIAAIDTGHVRFYESRDLHAKIYIGDTEALIGSSNFSQMGLHRQREANVRFAADTHDYRYLRAIAERFRDDATDCSASIRALLHDLLQFVTWPEALARGAAELLEGEWITRYPDIARLLRNQSLWPHQEQAIAQGLWILDTRGSVLVADATGSGKTRLGTHLLYSLMNRLWARGQGPRTNTTVVCPPQVVDNWSLEMHSVPGQQSLNAISHGLLSQGAHRDRLATRIQQTNILFLDEAHNYLATNSKRSKIIASSVADYTGLLTATPLNRGPKDLLRMIELMGLDTLSDDEFDTYKTLAHQPGRLEPAQIDDLRSIVGQYTIRRTKRDLNRFVERNPEGYRDANGRLCQYPEHRCKTYPTGETHTDRDLAVQIADYARRLRGLQWIYLTPPKSIRGPLDKEEQFFEQMCNAARGLVGYFVRSAMQSSRAALLEMIHGTEEAASMLDFPPGRKTESGDFLTSLDALRQEPPTAKNALSISLPAWLTTDFDETVDREQSLLRKISECARQMSAARTEARIRQIRSVQQEHPVLLVFDSRPLTLRHLHHALQHASHSTEIVVADGSLTNAQRRALTERLGLDGSATRLLVLCSDAMSEGLNLQRASAVILLDTPSVIRIAEQRVGRVDRMNSPHDAIEVHWPDNSPPFRTQTRDLLIERHRATHNLLGSNITLPNTMVDTFDDLATEDDQDVDADALIEEYFDHREHEGAAPLNDAFQPVRALVTDSPDAEAPPLISPPVYEQVAELSASAWSRVSVVRGDAPWGFFCIRATSERAPRWVFMHEKRSAPGTLSLHATPWTCLTHLDAIATQLRTRLPHVESLNADTAFANWEPVEKALTSMMKALRHHERDLLSHKARHALTLLNDVCTHYQSTTSDPDRKRYCNFVLSHLRGTAEDTANISALADAWLRLVQPRYVEWRRTQSGIVRLQDMLPSLVETPIPTSDLRELAHALVPEPHFDQRLAAAIIALAPAIA